MLTFEDIVGPHADCDDLTDDREANIRQRLLPACWALERMARADGVEFPINPCTGTSVSGQTFGGFRPQSCTIGAPKSNHKLGLAVDRYDPDGKIDQWCASHLDKLAEAGIWIEHPADTRGWSHWQCIAPRSGSRMFKP